MRLQLFQKTTMSALAGLLTLAAADLGAAESLAGSKGDSRYPVYFAPGSTGGCQKAYKAYVATGSHSAYASTPFNWATEFIVCARANGSSQKAAEALALKDCQSARKQYKVTTAGVCSIAASK